MLLVFLALGVVALMGRSAGEPHSGSWLKTGSANVQNHGYVTSIWEPLVAALAVPAGIPIEFGMQWVENETGGNPCDIGELNKFGPDGCPLEFGIAQVYNPDYYPFLGIKDGKSRRAYCTYPNTVNRQLTAEEMTQQVQDLVATIKYCVTNAGHHLVANHYPWLAGSRDYWRAVKLWHALPSIMSPGFAHVAAKYGIPKTWAEFRVGYVAIEPRAAFVPGKPHNEQSGYWRALENAENTGGVVPDSGGDVT